MTNETEWTWIILNRKSLYQFARRVSIHTSKSSENEQMRGLENPVFWSDWNVGLVIFEQKWQIL